MDKKSILEILARPELSFSEDQYQEIKNRKRKNNPGNTRVINLQNVCVRGIPTIPIPTLIDAEEEDQPVIERVMQSDFLPFWQDFLILHVKKYGFDNEFLVRPAEYCKARRYKSINFKKLHIMADRKILKFRITEKGIRVTLLNPKFWVLAEEEKCQVKSA